MKKSHPRLNSWPVAPLPMPSTKEGGHGYVFERLFYPKPIDLDKPIPHEKKLRNTRNDAKMLYLIVLLFFRVISRFS